MSWLAPNTVPTIGDWFRAGGYKTFYKGKWHVSHSHLEGADGKGYLQTVDKDGQLNRGERRRYLEATCSTTTASPSGLARKQHGLGYQNTGTARDPFTADETVALLKRLDQDGSEQPWLTVCSFLNPHDIALFGVIALAQGLRYDTEHRAVRSRCADPQRRPVDQARLSTKLHRRVGKDARAAAVGGDAAAILLPAAADG